MTNREYLMSLDDDRLSRLLKAIQINSIMEFLKGSQEQRIMSAREWKEWLKKEDDFVNFLTQIPDGWAMDQEYNLKEKL